MTTALRGRPAGGAAPVADPWHALWAMMVGFFMILVDATIVAVANPSIMEKLGAGYDAVIWVTSAYLLGFAVPLLHRRPTRRPVRAEEPLSDRPDGLHRRIAVVRPVRHHRHAHRGPRGAGRRRGAADPADPVHDHPHLPRRAARRGDERVGCHRRGRHPGRTAGRRCSGRRARLAVDLLRQRADRNHRAGPGLLVGSGTCPPRSAAST